MKLSNKIINTWSELKEQGDVNALAKKTGKNQATVSRILSGKQETTPDTIQIIVDFFNARKKQISKIAKSYGTSPT
jgi:plasmid maintenance system antidote protein VapI